MFPIGERCDLCAEPARGLCERCRFALEAPPAVDLRPELDSVLALCAYRHTGAALVRNAKFRNRRTALPVLAAALAPLVEKPVDGVVPVPTDPARVRRRGHDLPHLLARRIARELGVRVHPALRWAGRGSQHGLDRRHRLERHHVAAVTSASAPARVVLVDDVVTTGATARACASALRAAGSTAVHLVAIAATPPDRLRRS